MPSPLPRRVAHVLATAAVLALLAPSAAAAGLAPGGTAAPAPVAAPATEADTAADTGVPAADAPPAEPPADQPADQPAATLPGAPAPVPPPSLRPLPASERLSATSAGADAAGEGLTLVSETPATRLTEARAALADGPAEQNTPRLAVEGVGWATVLYAETREDRTGAVDAAAGAGSLRMDLGSATVEHGAVDARCTARADGTTDGTATLVDARLLPGWLPALRLSNAPEPNTEIELPSGLGRVVLNEQVHAADGSLTVTALRVELTGENPSRLVVGTVRCLPGAHAGTGADAPREEAAGHEEADGTARTTATVHARAVEAGRGADVPGVVLELTDAQDRVTGACVTTREGCTIEDVAPSSSMLCVVDAPSGYRLPQERDERCAGPFRVMAGDDLRLHEAFALERTATRS
ncbi:hypothetical protein [Streptomyces bohaiensis]|uniref:hypothetical protein n=1 Tax=Streptomyces bohaiensis TaxID=1431344 RepID=UPI003B7E997D